MVMPAIVVGGMGSTAVGSAVYLSAHDRSVLHSGWPQSVPVYMAPMNIETRTEPESPATPMDSEDAHDTP